jgi:hypothetical protein
MVDFHMHKLLFILAASLPAAHSTNAPPFSEHANPSGRESLKEGSWVAPAATRVQNALFQIWRSRRGMMSGSSSGPPSNSSKRREKSSRLLNSQKQNPMELSVWEMRMVSRMRQGVCNLRKVQMLCPFLFCSRTVYHVLNIINRCDKSAKKTPFDLR